MPSSGNVIGSNLLNIVSVVFISKAFLILFIVFYVVFTLLVFRQIQLMAKALPTPVSPYLKFLAIIQIGVALALLFVVIQLF